MPEVIHTHRSTRIKMNFWMGNLIYRHIFKAHAQKRIPLAPEPVGHNTNLDKQGDENTVTNVRAQKPRENGDSLIVDTMYEAETLKPGLDLGQEGRMVLDKAASVITRPVDKLVDGIRTTPIPNRGKTLGTSRNWDRGKTFGGGRGL